MNEKKPHPAPDKNACCPICGPNTVVKRRFQKGPYNIHLCQTCSLMFVNPKPSAEVLREIYSAEYFSRGNKYSRAEKRTPAAPDYRNDVQKLKLVQRYKPGGRLLDVGCALGGFLDVAKQNGYSVSGVEISKSAAEYVNKRLELEVHNGDLPSANLPSDHFDVITMWDVIEHLDSPHPTLSEIHRVLRQDGVVVLTTGDASSTWAKLTGKYWHLLTPPQHLYFYTPESLTRVLELNGLTRNKIEYPGKKASLDFVFFKARETLGPIVSPFQFLFRITKLGQCTLTVNLRDIMTCVAKKA